MAILAWLAFAQGSAERALVLGRSRPPALLGPAVLGVAQLRRPALKVSPRLAALRDRMPCPNPQAGRAWATASRSPSSSWSAPGSPCRPTGPPPDPSLERRRLPPALRGIPGPRRFQRGLAGGPRRARALAEVEGFNLNTGRRVFVTAYAVAP
ncbi:hypothetical protein ACU4GA_29850 [Methylobacterium oryzae CBMB20]